MKPLRLLLLLMALAGLFLLTSCGDDDDDNNNNTQFDNLDEYWDYVQDRDVVLFAEVFTDEWDKEGYMYVYFNGEKLPEGLTEDTEITLLANDQEVDVDLYVEGDESFLESD